MPFSVRRIHLQPPNSSLTNLCSLCISRRHEAIHRTDVSTPSRCHYCCDVAYLQFAPLLRDFLGPVSRRTKLLARIRRCRNGLASISASVSGLWISQLPLLALAASSSAHDEARSVAAVSMHITTPTLIAVLLPLPNPFTTPMFTNLRTRTSACH